MSYLLDTNVISELIRKKPNQNVINWFQTIPDDSLYLSVLSIGEVRKGVEKVTDSLKKEKLRIWLEHEIPLWFGNRIICIDNHVADRWGRLQYEMKQPLPAIDSLLAATALVHDLRIVTRNSVDFKVPSLEIINPWLVS